MSIYTVASEQVTVAVSMGGGYLYVQAYSRLVDDGWTLFDALPFPEIFSGGMDWTWWDLDRFPSAYLQGSVISLKSGGNITTDGVYDLLECYYTPVGSVNTINGYEMGWRLQAQATYVRRDTRGVPKYDLNEPSYDRDGSLYCPVAGWPEPTNLDEEWLTVMTSNYGGDADTGVGWWWLASHPDVSACNLVVLSQDTASATIPYAWQAITHTSPEVWAFEMLQEQGFEVRYYQPHYYVMLVQVWGRKLNPYATPQDTGYCTPTVKRRGLSSGMLPLIVPDLALLAGVSWWPDRV